MSGLLTRVATAVALASLMSSGALAVPGDIVFQRRDGVASEVAPAVFSHWYHRIRYKCYACHPAPFEMKAGANPITMEGILAGKYCGTCHNGTVAWASSFDNCNRCHVQKP
jgi:c(7)-type cytochrome triheme protein